MKHEINILLVEDNEGDILLTLEALNEAKIHNAINVVKDGDAALQYIKKEGEYVNVETPDLILLDINLPKMDGIEVLAKIKNDELLRVIPVVMLTTSDSEKDIFQAYQSHANCYITKPVNYANFMEVIQTIKDFWISIVKLPRIND
ncbi:MAG TPA: response regulator [Hanamia sp.]|jgi:two-component system, chemotaxis family, response regulator Rcp1|nr:response regulator [Hanamia sp.]